MHCTRAQHAHDISMVQVVAGLHRIALHIHVHALTYATHSDISAGLNSGTCSSCT